MGKNDYYYLILRHGDTHNDILDKKKYKSYAPKIVKYIYNICNKKNRIPIFLVSPIERCIETIQILIDLYNKKYNTTYTHIETPLLFRSGHEEHSAEKHKRLKSFIQYTQNTWDCKHIFVCITHSSVIPALCPIIADITPEYFKENHEVHLDEGSLAFVKYNTKITRYNKAFIS